MIKGKATIQLFDEKSGEVVKELHEENMITNAVDTILNPPDYIEIGMDSDNDRSFNLLRDFVGNIADTAFRGVIVCRDKIPEDGKQIPESTLQQVTADVLGQNDFTHEWLCHRIQHIRVCNDNTLIFYFKDGSEITRIWKDRSRSQSWTDEMKEAARQKTLERSKHNA